MSVLDPLLFLIYINDITKNIESVIKHFADDTSVSLALKDPDRRAAILNSDLEKICLNEGISLSLSLLSLALIAAHLNAAIIQVVTV